jgi:hypothetical protein
VCGRVIALTRVDETPKPTKHKGSE